TLPPASVPDLTSTRPPPQHIELRRTLRVPEIGHDLVCVAGDRSGEIASRRSPGESERGARGIRIVAEVQRRPSGVANANEEAAVLRARCVRIALELGA